MKKIDLDVLLYDSDKIFKNKDLIFKNSDLSFITSSFIHKIQDKIFRVLGTFNLNLW